MIVEIRKEGEVVDDYRFHISNRVMPNLIKLDIDAEPERFSVFNVFVDGDKVGTITVNVDIKRKERVQ